MTVRSLLGAAFLISHLTLQMRVFSKVNSKYPCPEIHLPFILFQSIYLTLVWGRAGRTFGLRPVKGVFSPNPPFF